MSNMTIKKKFLISADAAGICYFLDNDDKERYVTGPLVDRLHAFEEIGYEPDVIKDMLRTLEKLQEERATKRFDAAGTYGFTMNDRVDRKMINDILDRISEKKDVTLSIFVGSEGTSIDIRPYELSCEVTYTDEKKDDSDDINEPAPGLGKTWHPCITCHRFIECEGLKMSMNTLDDPCEEWSPCRKD